MSYPYSLPQLPYSFDALEPYIDKATMVVHYTKHHQTYIDNLNAILKDIPELHKRPLSDLLTNIDTLPERVRMGIRNQGGGVYNHTMFWNMMSLHKDQIPHEHLNAAIVQHFGSLQKFKDQFSSQAKKLFGSGYVWLSMDPQKKLIISALPNQDSPLTLGLIPIMCLDVWEHAYYLKYQNRRAEYIELWWHIVNWDYVSSLYQPFC